MRYLRYIAGVLACAMALGIMGCGATVNSQSRYNDPMSMPMPEQQQPRQGMSTRNKVLLVAGAAALYYLYQKNKNKNPQQLGPQGRYYRSKNGRIYYRDRNGKAVWVNEPRQPIQVPVDEWERYTGRSAEGYQGRVLREAPAGWY